MTDAEKREMKNFEARVRGLLMQYRRLQEDITELHNVIKGKDEEILRLHNAVEEERRNYQNLKTAKMIAISDTDIAHAKQRFSWLVREVNKCIGLLSIDTNDTSDVSESESQPSLP